MQIRIVEGQMDHGSVSADQNSGDSHSRRQRDPIRVDLNSNVSECQLPPPRILAISHMEGNMTCLL